MIVKLWIWGMVNNYCRIFTDGIVWIPIQGSDVKGLSINSSFVPHSSNSAGRFDELWEDVESFDLSGSTLEWSFSYTLDLFNVSGACVSSGNSDIEIQNFLQKFNGSSCDRLSNEFGEFFLKNGFKLGSIIIVEILKIFLHLLLHELSVSPPHLLRSSLDIYNVKVVSSDVWVIPNDEFLAVSDCLDESGLIVYKRLDISGDGAVLGEDSSDSE